MEKLNMGRYGISAFATLRGVVVDWDFIRACIRYWDPEAHVFRFGAMMDEMCPLFEEVCAILGCDPESPLARPEPQVGYIGSFERLFAFTRPYAQSMIVDGSKVALSSLIDEFLTADVSSELYRRRRMRAYVFCLLA